jgi:hypothetical protein
MLHHLSLFYFKYQLGCFLPHVAEWPVESGLLTWTVFIYLFIVLLFICAYKAWVISPPAPPPPSPPNPLNTR